MPILYSLVARDKIVLCEQTCCSGNFQTVTRIFLGKIEPEDGKKSFVYDNYMFHSIVSKGLTYLCMTEKNDKRRISFAFLDDIKDRFILLYGDRAKCAIAFEMNEDFGIILKKKMLFYNDPSNEHINKINKQLYDIKNIMVTNIDTILERGNKLELLVDKSENLHQQSLKFHVSSKKLKTAIVAQNIKIFLFSIFSISLTIWILSMSICGGFDYPRCHSS